jgi:hypothetical protein
MAPVSRSKISPKPTLLLFKRMPNGRHRAAWFTAIESLAAGKAAKSMGYRTLHLTDDAGQEVASRLPHGSLSNDGVTVPFVKKECLKQVLSVSPPKRTKAPSVRPHSRAASNAARLRSTVGEPVLIDVSPNPTRTVPHSWEEIEPGSEVLARDQHDEAWYEAVVVSVVGDVCQLKWRDYPGQPVLTCQRHRLGLMFPK